ncbi:MAG: cytochrome b/b6 domain-containing protein [Phyllobacterium sp.]
MNSKSIFYRHRLPVRLTHWINVVAIIFLLMSGLQIFNAHPFLYWGQFGANYDKPVLAIGAIPDGNGIRGVTMIGETAIRTTGVLGASEYNGQLRNRAFPAWITLPSYQDLASGRRWHFFFAWIFVINGTFYLLWSLLSGHFRRDLLPNTDQLTPRHLGHEIVDHARLRFAKGDAAKRYNALQKLAYLAMVLIVLPGMVLTGLTMSPGLNAAFPWMLDLFGGRQSARTIHFICAFLLVSFALVHVAMVLLSGFWNNMRSMITGRYAIKHGEKQEGPRS